MIRVIVSIPVEGQEEDGSRDFARDKTGGRRSWINMTMS